MTERPFRVFVDTNIWISAFINPNGPPALILDALRSRAFVPIVSPALLDELEDVLTRDRIKRRLHYSDLDIRATLRLLHSRAFQVLPTGTLRLSRDPKDDIHLEAAILAHADYVVSRDDDMKRDPAVITALREAGIQVVTVSAFLAILAGE